MRRIAALALVAIAVTSRAAEPELFTLTVNDVPAENDKVLTATFREIERTPDSSIVEVVRESGGSVSSSMFVLRGMCGVARARGERFFTSRPVSADPVRMEVTFPESGPEPDAMGPLAPGEPVVFSMAQCQMLGFSGQPGSAELPPEIVGVWATRESEFDSAFNLLGGEALYLAASGVAAIAGAPLPAIRSADGGVSTSLVGVGGSATYDAASRLLTITLRDGNRSMIVFAEYRAGEEVMVPWIGPEPSSFSQLSRRSHVVPIALERELAPSPPVP